MSLKLLVNGFFRSGTTILWKILRDSNPSMSVFYEPCHEQIMDNLKKFRQEPFDDEVQGFRVWNEYMEIPGLMEKIDKNHPNSGRGNLFPEKAEDVVAYVEIYDQLKKNCILQTNRWSFCLAEIGRAYDCRVIHIIRNPFDIYSSMLKVYMGQGSALKCLIKSALKPFYAGKAYGIIDMYEFVVRKFDHNYGKLDGKSGLLFKESPFNMFLIVWTLSNYHAIKGLEAIGETVIVYEKFTSNSKRAEKLVERAGEVLFKCDGVLKKSKRAEFADNEEKDELINITEKLGVGKEMRYILTKAAL
ncbi:hypothetical protein MNBD_NITROSPINAE03-699 [hydrothermal vent metagenome]|uniref:Sulfotransferase domain-containing protein n=1 Tax=hydrothermal vent metagenome TaxID=652676 RepID=A0A3B1BUE5_9ZZZZ